MNEDFERSKVSFEHNYEQFRSLNQTMWQVPVIAMTINGGLWYAAATITTSKWVPVFSLLLAFVFDLALICVLIRVRYVMGTYLTKIEEFSKKDFVTAPGTGFLTKPHVVQRSFVCALSVAAFLSAASIFLLERSPLSREGRAMYSQCDTPQRTISELAKQYESVAFADVHSGLYDLLPAPPARVLDVGAGSGRDSAALSRLGHEVTAVEPSTDMRSIAQTLHRGTPVKWLDDCLPTLATLTDTKVKYQLILVSAVMMYVAEAERLSSLIRLRDLLAPGGVIFVTLRHSSEKSNVPDLRDEDFREIVSKARLKIVRETSAPDVLGRSGISWTSFALTRATP